MPLLLLLLFSLSTVVWGAFGRTGLDLVEKMINSFHSAF